MRSLLIASILLTLPACQKGLSAANPHGADHPLVGAPAPAFELTQFGGDAVAGPSHTQGKVTLIDFWATWCEPCRDSFPVYDAIAKEYGDDLVIIAISEDEEPNGIAAFHEQTNVSFPVYWDEGQRVAKDYDPPTMPTSYLVDRAGIVRYVHVGFNAGDEATLRSQISALID
ncbi:MAG: TlpA family protein disulfide reductase [Polyangiaceae bacterium]|nr:TlpA family protein disulfide reductase [Polyangiaceae bacterium]MCW5791826.1 TlpA family protein disulfide reductase [Polyangiaceae bacterium]